MARYYDVDKLKEMIEAKADTLIDGKEAFLYIANWLNLLPTPDVAEIKHGYNKTLMNPVDEFWCSECGFCCSDFTQSYYEEDGDYTYYCECEFKFCPRCGAKMDGKKEGAAFLLELDKEDKP